MNHTWASRARLMAGAAALVLGCVQSLPAATVVYSNNVGGDAFTNSGPAHTGQAIGTSGWYYNNVRNNGSVGIDSTFPRNGDGSVHFQGPVGSVYKADVSFFNSASQDANGNFYATSSLGTLANLSTLSYDFYRDSTSTALAHLAPVIRIGVAGLVGNTVVTGYLIWEPVYNGFGAVPTDSWVSINAMNGGGSPVAYTNNFWGTSSLAVLLPSGTYAYGVGIGQWKGLLEDFQVIEISSGIGSGWDTAYNFNGAVDNIAFGFTGGTVQSFNFETQAVPEPSTVAMGLIAGGLGLVGSALRRRSQRGC